MKIIKLIFFQNINFAFIFIKVKVEKTLFNQLRYYIKQ